MPKYLKGNNLYPNEGLRVWYERELKKLIKKMALSTEKSVRRFFKRPVAVEFVEEQQIMDESISSQARILMNALRTQYQQLFNERALNLATRLLKKTDSLTKTDFKFAMSSLSDMISFTMDKLPANVREASKAAITENVSLIKSIPEKYFNRVTNAVTRSITSGEGFKYLTEHFSKYKGISDRQAKNMAIQQTRAAYNSISAQRMKAASLKMFEWAHSGGGLHPRKSHQAMNGKKFSLDALPIINQEQVEKGYEAPIRGLPGQAYGCGCTMIPVIRIGE